MGPKAPSKTCLLPPVLARRATMSAAAADSDGDDDAKADADAGGGSLSGGVSSTMTASAPSAATIDCTLHSVSSPKRRSRHRVASILARGGSRAAEENVVVWRRDHQKARRQSRKSNGECEWSFINRSRKPWPESRLVRACRRMSALPYLVRSLSPHFAQPSV